MRSVLLLDQETAGEIAEALGLDADTIVSVSYDLDEKKRTTRVEIIVDPTTAEDILEKELA